MNQTIVRMRPGPAGRSPARWQPEGEASVEIARDVACVPLLLANLYLYGERNARNGEWVLIDAGFRPAAQRIRRAARERFGWGSRPAAVVLTHGHFDHVGALPELLRRWDVPVYAHPMELPYLTGKSSYPPPDPAVGGGTISFLSRFFPRGPIDLGKRVRPLPPDGSVPHMPGWRWIHTPGHAPGHVSLFREADRLLIAGDAFVTTRQESAIAVLLQKTEVRRPPAYYTADWQSARESLIELAQLAPELAVTGHGLPMRGDGLRRGLAALIRDWDRAGVPGRGRYVRKPAIVSKHGLAWLPPPVLDRKLLVIGAVLALLAGRRLLRGRA